jgi:solute carrier family 25 citrate transporter 1
MMKQSANSAVRFTSYQTLKDWVAGRSGGKVGNLQIMGIGAAAGVITVCQWLPNSAGSARSPADATMPFE